MVLNCEDVFIKNKTVKVISKVYYQKGYFKKCMGVLQEWIEESLGD